MPHNTLATHKEVQAAIWAALKWVIGVGLGLAFASGAWASQVRSDLNRALDGVTAGSRVEKQVDSLRIEMRHIADDQHEVLTLLKNRK